uniref:Uncharacterized protein n=1 Tax=Chromera velia CCMP2878 TaxID=1169474 RepID=A0A0G4HS99_9ALVE|eukprot:Cvel_8207.t1-p1 / transcript=Cvel_8207.t1 / gene=Cvel_8207 / organism=Chromera_velia_CCMP2878 / gene_product=hypothetical protein / transcript_product=hypothetical protein / location=Cvel_scaffold447:66919-69839(+) / protein_length=599 / sequence_SO=supercontig / SO=protein_coding / is_pseudo=false
MKCVRLLFSILLGATLGSCEIKCSNPKCLGEVAAVGTPDNFDYDPEKNSLHHDLTGAHILILGDSRGSGRATVLQMLEVVGSTGKVLGGSRTPVSDLDETLKDLNDNDSRYVHFQFDMTKTPSYEYFKNVTLENTEVVIPGDLGADYTELKNQIETFLGGKIDHVIANAGLLAAGAIADVPWYHFNARARADLADHAVWDTVKEYMNTEYGTWISLATLDTRIHLDVTVPGYHSSKAYRALWALDMHATTRDHPKWKGIRFVSLEPSYVDSPISFPQHIVIPPEEDFDCPNTVNRTILLAQLLLNSPQIIPVLPSEVGAMIFEVIARKDIGKPFPDLKGGAVPNRISVWPSRERARGALGSLPRVIGEGGKIDLDNLYRNTPYSTIEALPGSELAFGLIGVRCRDQTLDDVWKEFGIEPEGVNRARVEGSVLGEVFFDALQTDREKILRWYAQKGLADEDDYEEALAKLGIDSEKVDQKVFEANEAFWPPAVALAEDLNRLNLKFGKGVAAPEEGDGTQATPEAIEGLENNPNAKLYPLFQDFKFAAEKPLESKEPVKGQWNPYEMGGKDSRSGNLATPSGVRIAADRLTGGKGENKDE